MLRNYPAIKLCILFISGILLQYWLVFDITHLLIITTGVILLILFFHIKPIETHTKILRQVFVVPLVLSLGALIFEVRNPELKQYPFPVSEVDDISFRGRIYKVELLRKTSIQLRMEVSEIERDSFSLKKNFLSIVNIYEKDFNRRFLLFKAIAPGMEIIVTGNYTRGSKPNYPGGFHYAEYLRKNGLAGILTVFGKENVRITNTEKDPVSATIHTIRVATANALDSLYSQNTAGLLKGLILGDKSDIDRTIQSEFVNAGVAHVLAVSGLNVGFILIVLYLLLGRFSIYLRSLGVLAGLIFFVMLCGFSPPVLRAAISALIILIVTITNRDSNSLNTLFLSALTILLFFPSDLFSPGFQLSFAGVLSLIVVNKPLQNLINKAGIKRNWLRNFLLLCAMTIAAQIGTLPITNYYFGKVSLTSIPANLLVVFAITVIMGNGLLSLLFYPLLSVLAGYIAATGEMIAQLTFRFVSLTGGESYSYLAVAGFGLFAIVLYYLILGCYIYFEKSMKSVKSRIALFVFFMLSLIVLVMTMQKPLFPRGENNLLIFQSGKSGVLVFSSEDGRTLLVNGGETTPKSSAAQYALIPVLNAMGKNYFDAAITNGITNPFFGGVFELARYGKVSNLIIPLEKEDSSNALAIVEQLQRFGQNYTWIQRTPFQRGNVVVHPLFIKSTTGKEYLSYTFSFGAENIVQCPALKTDEQKTLARMYGVFLKAKILVIELSSRLRVITPELLSAVQPEIIVTTGYVPNNIKNTIDKVTASAGIAKPQLLITADEGYIHFRNGSVVR